ncbi:hypothetical protein, partial [Sporomusa sp. GT1]|uniref:hypothetical protein n=1 Tax=Sporomusa sp. GT1 TaxID=1534747 RepID=UPI001CB7C94D
MPDNLIGAIGAEYNSGKSYPAHDKIVENKTRWPFVSHKMTRFLMKMSKNSEGKDAFFRNIYRHKAYLKFSLPASRTHGTRAIIIETALFLKEVDFYELWLQPQPAITQSQLSGRRL